MAPQGHGGEVAVLEVPSQPKAIVVHLKKQKGGDEEFYVRRGTRTDVLKGSELIEWLRARERR
jgi:hypothetical protein